MVHQVCVLNTSQGLVGERRVEHPERCPRLSNWLLKLGETARRESSSHRGAAGSIVEAVLNDGCVSAINPKEFGSVSGARHRSGRER